MRQYTEVRETSTNYTVSEVCCNKCGKSVDLSGFVNEEHEEMEREYATAQFQEFGTYFGYGSRYDSERWSFDLCEDCLEALIRTFKYAPAGFGEDSYVAMHPQATFEKWKETGIVDLEAGATPEEIEANGGSIYAPLDEEESE